jgi:hypothetical protein
MGSVSGAENNTQEENESEPTTKKAMSVRMNRESRIIPFPCKGGGRE